MTGETMAGQTVAGETAARSPLAEQAMAVGGEAGPAELRFAEVPFRAQIGLRVDPGSSGAERIATALGAALPTETGGVVRAGDLALVWLGPDEWLVIGPQGTEDDIQTTLASALGDTWGTVVDLSAHRTIIQLSGARARDVLNQGCALDLHPRVFPTDRSAQTMLGHAAVVLVCRDDHEPSYWILVRSSFARYLFAWLSDAAVEYGPLRPGGTGP